MPSYQTTGIVIGRTNFGEADRIVRVLTPGYGKLSAVAKGVRKIKSRLAGHLELFAVTELTLVSGRNLEIITSARLNWYPHALTDDYGRLSLANLCAELIGRVATENTPQPELYAHLDQTLRAIEAGAAGPLPQLWFKLRLLNLAGYRPQLSHCVVCGTASQTTNYAVSAERGGIVCQSDALAADSAATHQTVKLWRLLCDYPYTTVTQIAAAPALAALSLPACDLFYEHHLGKAVRLNA